MGPETREAMPPPNRPASESDSVDEGDLQVWAERYGPALRRYFQRKVGANDADDLVQEVFLSLQARGAEAGAIGNIEGYLFRSAANVVARRYQRQTWNWGEHRELDELESFHDELSPERVLMDKEALERVLEAMRALPPRCSEAFLLHRFEEMTYSAIAVRMKISTKAVEHLIQRALRRISLTLDPSL